MMRLSDRSNSAPFASIIHTYIYIYIYIYVNSTPLFGYVVPLVTTHSSTAVSIECATPGSLDFHSRPNRMISDKLVSTAMPFLPVNDTEENMTKIYFYLFVFAVFFSLEMSLVYI